MKRRRKRRKKGEGEKGEETELIAPLSSLDGRKKKKGFGRALNGRQISLMSNTKRKKKERARERKGERERKNGL